MKSYTKWIINTKERVFFFSLIIDFLKMLTDLAFLIPTLSLLSGTGVITEVDYNINREFS